MQARKLEEQQGIKPNVWRLSSDTKIAALEAQLRIHSQPVKGDVMLEEENTKEAAWGRNRGKPLVTC